jgi:16S rRNA (cytidine1402-2'-O)-methyltransferase
MTFGKLYLVSTPIGNLEDISIRSAKLLTEINVIACEDTRRSGILLEHLRKTYLAHPETAKKPQLLSYYEQNEEGRIPQLIEILKSGQDVALITDAGTPGISDPGFRIVKACRDQNIQVIGLPGASSVILALSISGLPTDKFTFLGYLPKKEGNAKNLLDNLKQSQELVKATVILFEAPHKLVETLKRIKQVFGDIEIVLCRELTKTYEEVTRKKNQRARLFSSGTKVA